MSRRSNSRAGADGRARPSSRRSWEVAGVCGLLAALVGCVFAQTLRFEFVNYDDMFVWQTPEVTRGLTFGGIAWAFTHSQVGCWIPLTTLTHMLDCRIYGLWPGGHHLTNVLLHAVAAILLFLVLRQMTGAFWRSAFVAALFAIHPLRVESVAWVSERKDVLSGLFFMLTLWAYTRFARRPESWGNYALVIVLFAMGLMCKPVLVTLPFVLLLLDYWPLGRFAQGSASAVAGRRNERGYPVLLRLIAEKIPLFALSAAASVATLLAQKNAVMTLGRLSPADRISNAISSYVIYLRQMFWPADLAVFYPHPSGGYSTWSVALAALGLAIISCAVVTLRKRHPYLVVGWCFYLGMLLPMIGIVQVGSQAHADRYTYLPQIGLYLMITWGGCALCSRWRCRRILLASASVVIVGSLGVRAWIQTSYWHQSESLWSHTLSCGPGNAFAHYNLGVLTAEKGRTDEAITHFNDCLKLKPDSAEAHLGLGNALVQKERMEEAMNHFRKALEFKPDYPEASINLAMALARKGRISEAMLQCRNVLETYPDAIPALNNLAWLLATSAEASVRDGAKAVQLAERAQRLTEGGDANVLDTLAAAYAAEGQFAKAVQTAQSALQLAEKQSNAALADSLRREMNLYRAGRRFEEVR